MGFEAIEPSAAWNKSFNSGAFKKSQFWVVDCNSNAFSS